MNGQLRSAHRLGTGTPRMNGSAAEARMFVPGLELRSVNSQDSNFVIAKCTHLSSWAKCHSMETHRSSERGRQRNLCAKGTSRGLLDADKR